MLPGKMPEDFKMMLGWNECDESRVRASVSFSAKWEYEIDRIIAAMKVVQGLMRSEMKPLPRDRSLVPASDPQR